MLKAATILNKYTTAPMFSLRVPEKLKILGAILFLPILAFSCAKEQEQQEEGQEQEKVRTVEKDDLSSPFRCWPLIINVHSSCCVSVVNMARASAFCGWTNKHL